MNFPLFCYRFRISRKTCLGHFGSRANAESEKGFPRGLERKKMPYDVKL